MHVERTFVGEFEFPMVWFNDQFIHFSSVFHQRTGVAIGGCMPPRQPPCQSCVVRRRRIDGKSPLHHSTEIVSLYVCRMMHQV